MKSSVADCLAAQSNAPGRSIGRNSGALESISKVCESADLLYEKFRRSTTILFPLTSQWCPDFLLNCCTFPEDAGLLRPPRLAGRSLLPSCCCQSEPLSPGSGSPCTGKPEHYCRTEALYEVDNNCYAFLFDEEVYYHFTEYILHQPKDRLMWGAGRILHHENLYGLVQRLKELDQMAIPGSLDVEIRRLEAAIRRQQACT